MLRLSIESLLIQLVNWYGFNLFFVRWASSTTSQWWCTVIIKRLCTLSIILFFLSKEAYWSRPPLYQRYGDDTLDGQFFCHIELLIWNIFTKVLSRKSFSILYSKVGMIDIYTPTWGRVLKSLIIIVSIRSQIVVTILESMFLYAIKSHVYICY